MIRFLIVTACLIGLSLAQSPSPNTTLCAGAAPNSFIPDVSACNKYFSCASDGAEAVSGTCPSPWLFNAKTRACDWKENVVCFSCPASPPYINLPVDNSCTHFIRCFNNVSEQHVCPGGLYFDPTVEECNLPSAVNCSIPVVVCPPGSSATPVFVRDPKNCANYYICVNGQQLNHTCPTPLYFNLDTNTCDFQNNTNCVGNPGNSTISQGIHSPPPPISTTFTCTYDGLFPDPSSCHRYIACASRRPYSYSCRSGLYYDPISTTCSIVRPPSCNVW